jgi:hypothetical protein
VLEIGRGALEVAASEAGGLQCDAELVQGNMYEDLSVVKGKGTLVFAYATCFETTDGASESCFLLHFAQRGRAYAAFRCIFACAADGSAKHDMT